MTPHSFHISRRRFLQTASTALAAPAYAQPYIQLTIMVFPGVQNLPLFAAQHTGPFGRRGLAFPSIVRTRGYFLGRLLSTAWSWAIFASYTASTVLT